MKLNLAVIAVLCAAASPVLAAGDAAKGEVVFKQCQTCHTVADDTGKVLAGKGGKIGPNLYGLFGRPAGSLEGFKYGKDIVAAGAAGMIWDEAHFVEYVQDPAGYLKKTLNKPNAVAKMSFKLKDAGTAADVYAYLAQFSPPPAEAAPAEAAPADAAAAPAEAAPADAAAAPATTSP